NSGTTDLTLGSVMVAGTGFTVTPLGSSTVAPNTSTTFEVEFSAATAGSFNGTVSFATNDADENPFNFTVASSVGGVTPPGGPPRIIDDGDSGFSVSGDWRGALGQGYQNDVRFAFAGNGSQTATWTFTDLEPGEYRVSATWSAHANRATDAP